MKAWWWALGLGAYGVYCCLRQIYRHAERARRQKDQFLVRAPIFGNLVHKIALSRFCRTYATLMRSGVPILRTLEIVSSASGKVQVEDACDGDCQTRQPRRAGFRNHGGEYVLPADDETHGQGG